MKYDLTKPCKDCPFHKKNAPGYRRGRLEQFASGEFVCHRTAALTDDDEGGEFVPTEESSHCAGALIYLEKRDMPHQMMRICERLGLYDRTKLDMDSPVI